MRSVGALELQVEPETETHPMRVSMVLRGARADEHGTILMSPECMSLDVLEGCINALQDELDILRAEARRVFTQKWAGHA